MTAAPERHGKRRSVPAVALLPAVIAGLLIGLLLASSGSPPDGPPSDAEPEATAGPSRWVDGVPAGFAHSREGAVAAVAAYEQAFASPRVLSAGALRKRVEAVAVPDYWQAMLAANGPGAERIAGGPIGAGLQRGVATIFSAVPIGYRVQSYSAARAKVLTWGFTLLGNASAVEPGAYFGTTETDVVWRADDWKIAGTSASFGPTPKLVTPRKALEGFDVLALAKELRSYGVAP